jgi:hypothetical protein
MKFIFGILGALTISTPALAYNVEYIPGTIPGCDRINGVYVCQDGYGNQWIPLPKKRWYRYYRQPAFNCGASALTILGVPVIGTINECQ